MSGVQYGPAILSKRLVKANGRKNGFLNAPTQLKLITELLVTYWISKYKIKIDKRINK